MNSENQAHPLTPSQKEGEQSRKFFSLKYYFFSFLLIASVTLSLLKCFAQADSVNHQTNNSASVVHHESIQQNHFLNFVIPTVTDNSIKPKDKWKFISPEKVLEKNSLPANNEVIVRKRNDEWKSWMFYLLLALAVFLVFMRVSYAREFSEVFQIFKPLGINQQIFRDNFGIIRLGAFLLSLNSAITIGVFLFLVALYFHLIPPYWWLLCVSLIIAGAILITRFGVLKIAGSLFPFRKEINFYQFNEVQLNRVTGIVLLPMLFFIVFAPEMVSKVVLFASITLVIAIILFRYIRGFSIGGDYFARHKFHFLVYICTLEIAPLVVFVKLVKEWTKGL